MLENRDYMRHDPSPDAPFRWSWTASTVLMVVLVAIYALQCLNDVYFHTRADWWLALTRDGLRSGWVWQLFTFQFLHADVWHLIWNLVAMWFFGRQIEAILGTKRFLVAYFGAGVIGGILQGSLTLLFPEHFGRVTVGASAGLAGVFALFAMLERHSIVRWSFLIPIPAFTLLMIYVAMELFFTIVPTPREMCVAHAAHLGGLCAGIAWVKLGWHRDFITLPWEGLFSRLTSWRPTRSRERKRTLVRAAVRSESWQRATQSAGEELPPDQFISKEVDPILDKISAHGIHSLTPRERQILEAARSKMGKR